MDIFDIIRSRRSVRKYKADAPRDKDIEKILEAGSWAPSGLNNQPWRLLIIKDKARKDGLCQFTKYGQVIKAAPVVVIVCMDTADSYNRDKDLMSIGACIQNMLLEAHSLGLASCWLGEILNKKDAVQGYLGLGQDLELMAVITLGYPESRLSSGCRKKLSLLMIK